MRPVNLIPPEERRGGGGPSRSGPMAYAVLGLLALVLVGVAAFVTFDRKVADRQQEAATLETEVTQTQSAVASLSDYVAFQQMHDARVETVTQLASSRFDWERVLRELAKVVPPDVWVTTLVGTVSPEALSGSAGGSSSTVRSEIEAPALELTGCGASHSDVAELVSAMKDIDGVTRVLASDSTLGSQTTSGSGSGDSCQTRPSVAQFHLIAAFDDLAVMAPATAPATEATATTTTETTESGSTTAEPNPTGGVDAAEQEGATGAPSAGQQQRIDTGKKIAGAG